MPRTSLKDFNYELYEKIKTYKYLYYMYKHQDEYYSSDPKSIFYTPHEERNKAYKKNFI